MGQTLWELTYPKPVSPKAWTHPEPKDPESGCLPGCVTRGPFGSGQHFSISPRGVLCLGGWDCLRSLERPGPHAGHSRGSPIGPSLLLLRLPRGVRQHHRPLPSPWMGFVCSHLCFYFLNGLFSIGFLAASCKISCGAKLGLHPHPATVS